MPLILMAEDDPDDRLLAGEAFAETKINAEIEFVDDGEQLLQRMRASAQNDGPPAPSLVLLDLNMPRKDGREVLAELRNDPVLRHTPVIVFTTSNAEEDVCAAYRAGASSFVVKANTFEQLVRDLRAIMTYWLEIASLPRCRQAIHQ